MCSNGGGGLTKGKGANALGKPSPLNWNVLRPYFFRKIIENSKPQVRWKSLSADIDFFFAFALEIIFFSSLTRTHPSSSPVSALSHFLSFLFAFCDLCKLLVVDKRATLVVLCVFIIQHGTTAVWFARVWFLCLGEKNQCDGKRVWKPMAETRCACRINWIAQYWRYLSVISLTKVY